MDPAAAVTLLQLTIDLRTVPASTLIEILQECSERPFGDALPRTRGDQDCAVALATLLPRGCGGRAAGASTGAAG